MRLRNVPRKIKGFVPKMNYSVAYVVVLGEIVILTRFGLPYPNQSFGLTMDALPQGQLMRVHFKTHRMRLEFVAAQMMGRHAQLLLTVTKTS